MTATLEQSYSLPSDESEQAFYLIKSEPNTRMEKGMDMKFSLTDLIECENQTAEWDGVRNYLARNILKSMKIGDYCFFYHSNCKPPGIVGVVQVVKEAYPDHTQFDAKNPHFDASSKKDDPRWIMVDVKYVRSLKRMLSLDELKLYRTAELSNMDLFVKARLSCQRVSAAEWNFLHNLEENEDRETDETDVDKAEGGNKSVSKTKQTTQRSKKKTDEGRKENILGQAAPTSSAATEKQKTLSRERKRRGSNKRDSLVELESDGMSSEDEIPKGRKKATRKAGNLKHKD
eukprot:Selendium_serpulae@DN6325_c0_g1_i1.p1